MKDRVIFSIGNEEFVLTTDEALALIRRINLAIAQAEAKS